MRNMIHNGKYYLGKHNGGECYLTWELYTNDKGKICFSMQGEEWLPSKRDIRMGGQCCDTILSYFPNDQKAQRMVEIWKEWHLNDMKAGTPNQEKAIKNWLSSGIRYDYSAACEYLRTQNLYNDNGYVYGTAWLHQDIPENIIEEIKLF